MNLRLAKNSGFCFGVKRAIKMALKATKENHQTVTLGPIIHNPQMVSKLESKNILAVDNISQIKNRATIIRSHGVKKNVLDRLKEKEIEIINATCPYVSKTQKFAEELDKEGYKIIILGDKDHPEVKSLYSYINGDALIVANAKELPDMSFKKVGVISQTTRSINDFQELVSELVKRSEEMRIINTICNATSVRQNSTIELAKISDAMIVVGGKNSSNTKMLAKISGKYVKTYHVETACEIKKKWFSKTEDIGITAGASTPDWVIVDVYNKIIEIIGKLDKKIEKVEDIPGFKEER